ncbi:hypothetical protein ADH75_13605 [Flavonifractor plautii]|nr:hypothetical protein A4U99_18385 [Flavonifractor plautii]OXE44611.1 hypothetical protein ADH75_13605 [Flavonifractor plautii]
MASDAQELSPGGGRAGAPGGVPGGGLPLLRGARDSAGHPYRPPAGLSAPGLLAQPLASAPQRRGAAPRGGRPGQRISAVPEPPVSYRALPARRAASGRLPPPCALL